MKFLTVQRALYCAFRSVARLVPLALAVLPLLAQQNWQWANSLPASIAWKDAAYGHGLYVVVGADGTIATSPDTVTWTIRRMSTANVVLNSIDYGDGLFVAVGMGTPDASGAGLVMTSADGINWTINSTVAASYNAQYHTVVHGDGLWVLGGGAAARARVLTSPDGLTWSPLAADTVIIPEGSAYGNGRFVVAGSGNSVITSADGATWTQIAVAGSIGNSAPYISDVAFNGTMFIAVGRDNNFNAVAYTSTDGTSWTIANALAGGGGGVGLISVCASPTAVVGAGGKLVFSSPDGVSWTKQTSALPNSARQLGAQFEGVSWTACANNVFFVFGSYGSITTSLDGGTWTRQSTGTINDLSGLIFDGTQFVASGAGGTILTSPDGATWTQINTGTTANFGRLTYNGTRYVTADYAGIYHSSDLTTWTNVSGTQYERYKDVACGNGKFVAAYDATALGARTSVDGVTWSAAVGIASSGGNTVGLVFGGDKFVLAMLGYGSTAPKLFTSADGIAWSNTTPTGMTASPESIAYGNNRFVILNSDRQSVTSPDGTNWTINALPTTFALSSVKFVGHQFIARSAGYGAAAYSSADGVTWTPVENSFAPNSLIERMVAHDSVVVGIGSAGTILRGDLLVVAAPTSYLSNLSVRAATTAAQTLIVGFVVDGGAKPILVRAAGPALAQFGVAGVSDPNVTLFDGSTVVTSNDNWDPSLASTFASLGAFAFDAGSKDAAFLQPVSGPHTAQATTTDTGSVLVEAYDAGPDDGRKMVNLSTRFRVGTGNDILIAGFVLGGAGPRQLLIRAVGPTLTTFGVAGALADPQLSVYDGGSPIAANDDWDPSLASSFTTVGAFDLPHASKDAAVLLTLQPGNAYTVQVSGVGGTTGEALVEIYAMP